MKMPNGYGSVVNLGGKRRKPFAVRITDGYRLNQNGTATQKFKYLGYFEKRKDAMTYLASYNSGQVVAEHESLSKSPTFSEVFHNWLEHKQSLKKSISPATVRNYKLAFGFLEDIHSKRINIITVDDLQIIANKYSEKSKSTVGFIQTVLKQTFDYALKREYVEKNIVSRIDFEYTDSTESIHSAFTDKEIQLLWDSAELNPNAKFALLLIYTGLRPKELLLIENKNVHLNDRYLVGGMKTAAGTNRIIPIHKKIQPIIADLYDPASKHLIVNTKGNPYSYSAFYQNIWTVLMNSLELNHLPHDGRHTFATLLNRAGADDLHVKLIMGHSVNDLTKRVYTHVSPAELVATIDLLE